MSAPASTPRRSGITPGQIIQLIQLFRTLTTEQVRRLLRNGDLLLLIARIEASEDSAVRLRQYASGYVPIAYYYRTNGVGLAGWIMYCQDWVVQTGPDTYEPWLTHYGLEFAEGGRGAEQIKRAIRQHWVDY